MSKPELQTVVSSDAEAAGSFTAVESIDQYIFDAGVLVRLDELEVVRAQAVRDWRLRIRPPASRRSATRGDWPTLLRRWRSDASALLACAGIYPKRKRPRRSATERAVARSRRGQPVARKRVGKSRPHVLALDLASVICYSSVITEALPSRYHRRVMATLNSFGTRTEIRVDGQPVQIYSLPALEKAGFPGRVAPAVLDEGAARKPAAPRGWRLRQGRRHQGRCAVERDRERREGNLLHAGARAAAGLHRRPVRRRSGRDARCRHRAERERGSGQSAATGGTGHRSLGAGGLLRPRGCVRA